MGITNEEIYEKLTNMESMIQTMLRVNKSDKLKILEDELKKRKRIDVGQVQSLLGTSRPWALTLMRKLSKESNYKFIKGSKERKTPSVLLYSEQEIIKGINEKIMLSLEGKEFISLADICQILRLNVQTDLEQAREIAKKFTETHKEYDLEGPKLIKKH